MKNRNFGSTGVQSSEIVFGGWRAVGGIHCVESPATKLRMASKYSLSPKFSRLLCPAPGMVNNRLFGDTNSWYMSTAC